MIQRSPSLWCGGATHRTRSKSIAASRNGLGLVVDDLGTLSPDEAEVVAYMLGNGVGKGRLTRDVQLREVEKMGVLRALLRRGDAAGPRPTSAL